MSATATTVDLGADVTLTASATSRGKPLARATAVVSRAITGSSELLTTELTADAAGQVTLTEMPTATTTYTFQVAQQLPSRAAAASVKISVVAPTTPTTSPSPSPDNTAALTPGPSSTP